MFFWFVLRDVGNKKNEDEKELFCRFEVAMEMRGQKRPWLKDQNPPEPTKFRKQSPTIIIFEQHFPLVAPFLCAQESQRFARTSPLLYAAFRTYLQKLPVLHSITFQLLQFPHWLTTLKDRIHGWPAQKEFIHLRYHPALGVIFAFDLEDGRSFQLAFNLCEQPDRIQCRINRGKTKVSSDIHIGFWPPFWSLVTVARMQLEVYTFPDAEFFRVKTKETRQIVGTGLGLSIVKSIVAAHLGTISVESKAGTGTTFTILLPKESVSPLKENS